MNPPVTALITGASAGLGAEFARQLAAAGAQHLVLVARREERLTELAEALTKAYPALTCTVLTADLADPGAPARLAKVLEERELRVNYLVNNAGSGGPTLLDGSSWGAHGAFLQLMMTSITELCHTLVPGMVTDGFGRVINVSSVSGRIAQPGDGHYGPSKAYVIALSESLGLTLRGTGVHVTALCPGFTHTEFHDTGELAAMKASIPGFVWYGADVVVRDALRAVERGRLICISGRMYRWLDPVLQWKWSRRLLQRLT